VTSCSTHSRQTFHHRSSPSRTWSRWSTAPTRGRRRPRPAWRWTSRCSSGCGPTSSAPRTSLRRSSTASSPPATAAPTPTRRPRPPPSSRRPRPSSWTPSWRSCSSASPISSRPTLFCFLNHQNRSGILPHMHFFNNGLPSSTTAYQY